MKAAALTHRGLEDVCAADVSSILSVKTTNGDGVVYFEAELEQLCELCYRMRSALRILVLLGKTRLDEKAPEKLAQTVDIKAWLSPDVTYAVRAHDMDNSTEHAANVGGLLQDKSGAKVNLSSPDVTVALVPAGDELLIGIDLGGELWKRDYRIFLAGDQLQGTLAYGVLSLAGYDGTQDVTDVFCRSGVIPIEAALVRGNTSPHKRQRDFPFRRLPTMRDLDWDERFNAWDKKERHGKGTIIAMDEQFAAVNATRKNATIADVVKQMEFSRTDMQFLDAKFGKGGLALMVSMPPQPSARLNGRLLEKSLEQLFYQAEFIIKKGGVLCLITRTNEKLINEHAKKYKFTLKEERLVYQGQMAMKVLVFVK